MISVFDKKDECCGCTACKNICPTKAIDMIPDEEGFLYPEINQELCIDCGLCRSLCAFQNEYNTYSNLGTPKVYAAKHKDKNVRMNSSSGGAFTAISDYVLGNKGIVFGVAFDENMNAVHRRANTSEERDKFKGSKYVQSDLKSTYKEIKQLLEEDIQVLFTGTPCQTAGLNKFLGGHNTKKLILCDIVCHGTPSPLMWRDHIEYLEKKEKSKVANYYCRHKVKGWHTHTEMVIYNNGKKDYKSTISQKHKTLFYSHNILRPSCHNCKYTNLIRPSDVTIADFWGIEKYMPDFDDNKGVSLVLVNTEKGEQIFKDITKSLIIRESNIKDCMQRPLKEPSKPSQSRVEFWEDYKTHGYDYIIEKYAGYNLKSIIKQNIKLVLIKLGLFKYLRQ